MSDSNTSNPQDPLNGDGSRSRMHEMITAYIDNEIRDPKEIEEIESGLKSDSDLYNRYVFEKLSKQRAKESFKYQGPPLYLQKSIGTEIDNYIKKASKKQNSPAVPGSVSPKQLPPHFDESKSSLKRNLFIGSSVFVLLLVSVFYFSSLMTNNPTLAPNDLVSVSRDVFHKIVAGQIPLQIKSSNAQNLADSMNKYLDFKVFVPDVKDAELLGGTCNEINGEKLAHIIHKKGNVYIYTLQGNKDHVRGNGSKIVLCEDFMNNITKGINWFPCLKDENATAVVWFKDNVICSSVAKMDNKEITAVLTNYK
jgi:hypothetical protein